MSDLICVTNRHLCGGDFLERISLLAACHPAAILLREKDLSGEDYETLARQVLAVCKENGVPCILHTWVDAALRLGAGAVQLTLPDLRRLDDAGGLAIGASCHSVEEAVEAERLGCTWLIAGHIFETDCKAGMEGRGLSFLREVCAAVSVPVLAIGGIDADRIADVRSAGAAGVCVMSGCMQCADVRQYLLRFI